MTALTEEVIDERNQASAPESGARPRLAPEDKHYSTRLVKLKPTKAQEAELDSWLETLSWVYNWALMTIEIDAAKKKYYSLNDFRNLLSGQYDRFNIPGQVVQATLAQAHNAWSRCFQKVSKKPRRKDARNRFRSIPFPARTSIPEPGVLGIRGFFEKDRTDPRARLLYKQQHGPRLRCLDGSAEGTLSSVPGVGMIDLIPKELLRSCRIFRKASGWYAAIVVAQAPRPVPITGYGKVGIDPGYTHLLTLSTGEKIEHPRELQRGAQRLAQAQRGGNKHLTARLGERMANRRMDRNHKLSRRLVSENELIVISKDSLTGLARSGFGKSVAAAGVGQLKQMLLSKSRTGKRECVEVDSRYSTVTCSICGSLSGPKGRAGLKVREWTCTVCGTLHDRDINSAVYTITSGAGQALETLDTPYRGMLRGLEYTHSWNGAVAKKRGRTNQVWV